MNCWAVPSSVLEGCGGGGGMPATQPCKGGHGRDGEEEEKEEVGRGGGGEDKHVEDCEGEEGERERESDDGEEEEKSLFLTSSSSSFLPPASTDRIRYRHIWMDGKKKPSKYSSEWIRNITLFIFSTNPLLPHLSPTSGDSITFVFLQNVKSAKNKQNSQLHIFALPDIVLTLFGL